MSGETPEAHIDRTILNELQGSRSTPAEIGANTKLTRQFVERRLKLLEADRYVESDDRGGYVVREPRESEVE